ncbi:phosphotransferase family protein [Saccharothrix luteola]|uniref:phosphotransferase family protein n=1 Tax=Saccharothrix luteola TaxID=2893018 RepID=UPI001E4988A3|nr:phosphotransferase [Saccharothrix luteola]MCC8242693.1 aminoglycoside phosphotransferase family protein [Saccharothrix luteola]
MADTPDAEVLLTGGRITPGVVRIGDTVRRPTTASSAFVAELLAQLEQRWFIGAPRHLGLDEACRDTFSYLPGWVPARFQHWTDTQVVAAGALLRSLHDATRDSGLTAGHPVICHHDPGPNNTVLRDGRPVAFIDFDTAAPGDPLENLGYMASTSCVSSKTTAPPAADRADVVTAMLDRQSRNARW